MCERVYLTVVLFLIFIFQKSLILCLFSQISCRVRLMILMMYGHSRTVSSFRIMSLHVTQPHHVTPCDMNMVFRSGSRSHLANY